MRLTIIGLLFLVAVGTLLWLGFQAGSIPHYSIPQLTSTAYAGEECRLDGAKIEAIESFANPLRFVVRAESGAVMTVVSPRNPPDNFKVGNSVGLKGYYRASEGVFEANDVTTACPSKYEGEDGAGGYGPEQQIPGMESVPAAPAS